MCPKCFLQIAAKPNNYQFLFTFLKFVTISRINYQDQVNSWKSLWKFCNDPHWKNKSGFSPLLNVAVYWQSSTTEACPKKLLLANNIDNGGWGIGLRIYVRYCSLPALFSTWFLKRNIPLIYCVISPSSIVWLPLACEILGNICILIVL